MVRETNRPRKIDEAVASAFNRAGLEASSYLHPELLTQITRNVIKQLQSGDGLDDSTSVPPRFSRFSLRPPLHHHPLPQKHHPIYPTERTHLLHRRNTYFTEVIPHRSRNQDIYCMGYRVRESTNHLTSAHPGLRLKA